MSGTDRPDAAVPPLDLGGRLPTGRLLVEASAGTGKTFAIASLAMRLLVERADLRAAELLMVTFTRAATAELRDRVRRRLQDAAAALERARRGEQVADDAALAAVCDADADELDARAQRADRALRQLDEATVATIHGFCQRLRRERALETGVPLERELAGSLSGVRARAVEEVAAGEVAELPAAWWALLAARGLTDPQRLDRLLAARTRWRDAQVRPDPTGLPERLADLPGWWEQHLADLGRCWADDGQEQLEAWHDRLRRDPGGRLPKMTGTVSGLLERLAERPGQGLAGLLGVDPAATADPDRVDRALKELARGLKPVAVGSVAAALQVGVGALDPPGMAVLAERVRTPLAAAGTILAERLRTAYEQEQERQRLLGYDDLLAVVVDALRDPLAGPAVRRAVAGRYRAVLVDEFQDTDPAQWEIFDGLFPRDDDGTVMVLVGDPKQAIYRFRGADLRTYLRARDHGGAARARLDRSFRSDQPLLDGLAAMLGQRSALLDDDLVVDPLHAADHLDRSRISGDRWARPLELRVVGFAAAEQDGAIVGGNERKRANAEIRAEDARRIVARDVAGRVGAALDDDGPSVADGDGDPRRLRAGDVAVLVRTHRQAAAVVEQLRALRVPVVRHGDRGVLDTPAAEAVQRLLDALVEPADDARAVALAASPLGGWRAEQLEQVDEASWGRWLATTARWAERWRRGGVAACLRTALTDAEAPRRLLAEPDGERLLADLLHLGELLHDVEQTDGLGGEQLAAWLRRERRDDESEEAHRRRLERDVEAVQVVTVHGAKGLQFPVVLVPFLWDVPAGEEDLREHTVAYDPDGTLVLDLHHRDDATANGVSAEPKVGHVEQARRDRAAEECRLAYVALTRARHQCVVWTGPLAGVTDSPAGWMLHAPDAADAAARRTALTDRVIARSPDGVEGRDHHWRHELLAGVYLADAHRLARRAGAERCEVHRVDGVDRAPVADAPTARAEQQAGRLAARPYTRTTPIDRHWGRTSYSALTRLDPVPAEVEGDHDRDVDRRDAAAPGPGREAAVTRPAPTGGTGAQPVRAGEAVATGAGGHDGDDEQVPLAGFPRGARAGTFLHAVLEQAELAAAPEAFAAPAGRLLARHGFDPSWEPTVSHGLARACATPIDGAARLADLGSGDRADELSFELPIAGGDDAEGRASLTVAAIAEVLDAHAGQPGCPPAAAVDRLRRMPARRTRGFLTGSVDLLARLPDGRFLVADYKSNWLGGADADGRPVSTPADYHPDRLAAAMVDGDYHLQALLYLVAVHRLLRWRLVDYDYDRHVAGVAYLFLRGMTGRPTADGRAHGVHLDRPPQQLVDHLDALLRDGVTEAGR